LSDGRRAGERPAETTPRSPATRSFRRGLRSSLGAAAPDPAANGAWRALTALAYKWEFYSVESYFRESWSDVQRILGDRAVDTIQGIALVTFKPEAIVARRIESALGYLQEHAFAPLLCQRIRYTQRSMREIWRYQWNIATLDRLAVLDELNTAGDSLFVVFGHPPTPDGVPASVRLRDLKGSAIPERRRSDQLRAAMGGANRLFTFFHATDEPADVVRELGVLFPRSERCAILEALRDSDGCTGADEVAAATRALYAEIPARSLDLTPVLERVRAAVEGTGAAALLEAAARGAPLAWREFSEAAAAAGVHVEPWDRVVLGAHLVRHDVPGEKCIIDEDGREDWLRPAQFDE